MTVKKKRLTILGSTGSIGVSALDVVAQHPSRFEVVALGAGSNAEVLARQIEQFHPRRVCLQSEEAAKKLKGLLPRNGVEILCGAEGMKELARTKEADSVVSAIVGAAGMEPTVAAIEAGKQICLANKETLVTAGQFVTAKVKEHGVELLPVDSEHSAIFQALQGNDIAKVRRLILTASGGPFRTWTKAQIEKATPEQALKHPNWSMGRKITIDSAGLMNKGLEVIEARWLFGLGPEKIDVYIHPQSIVHSMVEYEDSSVMAQLSVPDMKLPIAYAIAYPERVPSGLAFLTVDKMRELTFESVDHEKFPALGLAFEALRQSGSMPTVLNAANEVAVDAFLAGKIGFYGIPDVCAKVMGRHKAETLRSLAHVREADAWARECAEGLVGGKN
ncbi:MAG: 1-deoxy-D-xylulose-5-phosphate reductoisomerase [Bdellovibrionota bacterium]